MDKRVEKNVLLSKYVTLKVGGPADLFVTVDTLAELESGLSFAEESNLPVLVIGGGSNIFFNDVGYRGLVIKNQIKGLSYSVYGDNVYLKCGAGEILDEAIEDSVANNYWGLENLSSIPGTIGACPIQNVGAYGVEVSSLITEVSAINKKTREIKIFSNKECVFSYRDSFFKTEAGKDWIIMEVVFKLSLINKPNLSYGALQRLSDNAKVVSLQSIRKEIIEIRSKKFPDWKKVGTAGSFFKNPIIDNKLFSELKEKYPDLPGYSEGENKTKISLGWILDNVCQLRGFCQDGVCLYQEQALVLVNESANSAEKINAFANYVAAVVEEKIGVKVEREVNYV